MKNILVTGGAGFIGGQACHSLIDLGFIKNRARCGISCTGPDLFWGVNFFCLRQITTCRYKPALRPPAAQPIQYSELGL